MVIAAESALCQYVCCVPSGEQYRLWNSYLYQKRLCDRCCLSVCHSVRHPVSRITEKVMSRFH